MTVMILERKTKSFWFLPFLSSEIFNIICLYIDFTSIIVSKSLSLSFPWSNSWRVFGWVVDHRMIRSLCVCISIIFKRLWILLLDWIIFNQVTFFQLLFLYWNWSIFFSSIIITQIIISLSIRDWHFSSSWHYYC